MRAVPQRWRTTAIALLALASSAVGLINGFTYDDRYVVELNPATHDLHRWWTAFASSYWPRDFGGDGYRPITILAYKIESVIGGGIPLVFHAVNVALYILSALLVYALAKRLLPGWAAWLAAGLFAVHPVHVEAVAGVVGQSELIVAVALLGGVLLYLRDRRAGELRTRTAGWIALLYVVACLAKEHGIVLPALLAAVELTLVSDAGTDVGTDVSIAERVRRLRPFYLVLTLLAVAFVAVRSVVLSDHGIGGFQPFTPFSTLHTTGTERVLTALGVVPEWFRLLFWPVHLASEYGPPDIQIAQQVSIAQLPGFLLLVGTLTLGFLLRRRQPVASFGVAFAAITLLPSSNFLVPAGIVLAERTLFLPSVGAVLVVGAVAVWLAARLAPRLSNPRLAARAAAVACALLLVTGAVRSSRRTMVWHDNDRLFDQAVLDAPRAYRAHYMLGAWSIEKHRFRKGEAEYRRALALFPYDPNVSYTLAEQYRRLGFCQAAIPLYQWSFGLDPEFPMGHTALTSCLITEKQFADARTEAFAGLRAGASPRLMRRVIAIADSVRAADARKGSDGSVSLAGKRGKVPDAGQKTARPGDRSPSRVTGKSFD